MFDVGFSELVVIGIVALVVIGPERLPKVARTAGLLLGRLQRYVNDVKADISREMQLDELKKLQSELQDSARSFEHSVNSEMATVQQLADQSVAEVKEAVSPIGAVEPPPAVAVAAASADAAEPTAAAPVAALLAAPPAAPVNKDGT
jgi:sec-independent protein translocase protein TatB